MNTNDDYLDLTGVSEWMENQAAGRKIHVEEASWSWEPDPDELPLKRELIGRVGVDSGQLMLIDPCYVTDEQWGSDGYDRACDATGLSAKGHGILNYAMGHPGLAAVFSSGYGDGVYPVYAYRNQEGRIVRVVVEMA